MSASRSYVHIQFSGVYNIIHRMLESTSSSHVGSHLPTVFYSFFPCFSSPFFFYSHFPSPHHNANFYLHMSIWAGKGVASLFSPRGKCITFGVNQRFPLGCKRNITFSVECIWPITPCPGNSSELHRFTPAAGTSLVTDNGFASRIFCDSGRTNT